MPIVYIKGDVTEAKEDIIAHGVNCMGAMGSGVAKALMTKWPEVRKRYMDNHQLKGWKLGDLQLVYVSVDEKDEQMVANCATQRHYIPRGEQHVNYPAVFMCMSKLHDYCTQNKLTLAMPKIGAGLAGGDWIKIEKIINDVFHDMEVKVYVQD